jgi:amino acid adenylation domain-containing protein
MLGDVTVRHILGAEASPMFDNASTRASLSVLGPSMLATKLDPPSEPPIAIERGNGMNQTALTVSYTWPLLPVNLSLAPRAHAARCGTSASSLTESQLFAAWCVLLQRYSRLEEFTIAVGSQAGTQVFNVELPANRDVTEVERRLSATYAQRSVGHQADVSGGIGFTARLDANAEACRQQWDLDVLAAATLGESGWQLEVAVHPERYRSLDPAELVKRWSNTALALRSATSAAAITPISELPLLTPDEAAVQRALLRGPVETAVPPLPHVAFAERAAETPDAIAVECDGVTWTYGQLEQRSNQIARWLLTQGNESSDTPTADANPEPKRVLVSMEPCCEFLACLLGIFKAGFTHVPLDPAYPAARQQVIVEDTQPLLILTQAALAAPLQALGARIVVADGPAEFDGESMAPLERVAVRERVAYIIYTSGTTGRPKGVEITYANLAHYITVARNMYGYRASDIIPAMARSSFSITFFELLSPLVAGGKLLFLNRADVLDTAKMLLVLQTVTCIHASPALWRRLLAHIRETGLGPDAFGNLRHASSGGDMIPPDVLEGLRSQFPTAELYVIYGSSEISCMGCTFRVDNNRPVVRTQVGRAFPNMTVRVLDAALNPVPEGVVGHVHFGGAGLGRGYLNAPELTTTKFPSIDGERLYNIGDVGRLDAAGNLELLGRSDFQIKLRGIRIEPGEIETVLRKVPGVRDALVSAVVMEDGDPRLIAYVVPENPEVRAREVLDYAKRNLPDYMVPGGFVFLPQLPVNVNNKLDRLSLPAPTKDNLAQLTSGTPARNDQQRRLIAIWESLLGIRGVGIDDDFFDLGGDSLRAVDMMTRIEREFGVVLPVSVLLSRSTVQALAPLLNPGAKTRDPEQNVVSLRPGTGAGSVFLVHDGEGEVFLYRNIANRLPKDLSVYGILPKTDGRQPIVQTRISEIVTHYANLVQETHKHGPYILGGLCIGGFLASEVARELKRRGAGTPLVLLFDVAHVTTPPRSRAVERGGRFRSAALSAWTKDAPLLDRVGEVLQVASGKAMSTGDYLLQSFAHRARRKGEVRVLRWLLDRNLPLPQALSHVTVDSVLRFAEREFVVPPPYEGQVVLFAATEKQASLAGTQIDDTPYRDLFQDPNLGWQDKAARFAKLKIAAGHSSMLQEPFVAAVADGAQAFIAAWLDESATSRAKL